jgi:adenylate kinase
MTTSLPSTRGHSGVMQLVLLGAPGSGKGTQGAVLAHHFGIRHVSSGALLREHVAAASELGQKVSSFLLRGELVPDDLVLEVVGDALRGAVKAGGYVLDGIPRTLAQAERAYALAEPAGLVADAVIYLDVADDVARVRLASRAVAGRADDADPAVIERRLQVFHADTSPLLDFYRERGILLAIDGARSAGAVSRSILDALTHQDE